MRCAIVFCLAAVLMCSGSAFGLSPSADLNNDGQVNLLDFSIAAQGGEFDRIVPVMEEWLMAKGYLALGMPAVGGYPSIPVCAGTNFPAFGLNKWSICFWIQSTMAELQTYPDGDVSGIVFASNGTVKSFTPQMQFKVYSYKDFAFSLDHWFGNPPSDHYESYTVDSGTEVLTQGQWRHVAIVSNGTVLKMYVDGVVTASTTMTYVITPALAPIFFYEKGQFPEQGQDGWYPLLSLWPFLIDDFRIYGGELSQAEVRTICVYPSLVGKEYAAGDAVAPCTLAYGFDTGVLTQAVDLIGGVPMSMGNAARIQAGGVPLISVGSLCHGAVTNKSTLGFTSVDNEVYQGGTPNSMVLTNNGVCENTCLGGN